MVRFALSPAFITQPAYDALRSRHLASLGYVVAIPRFPDFPNEDILRGYYANT
jgi:hypothetical protein